MKITKTSSRPLSQLADLSAKIQKLFYAFWVAFFLSTAFLTACTDQSPSDETVTLEPKPLDTSDWAEYSKDGLVVRYPKSWTLSYDESPALYADRAIGFENADAESATVYIFDKPKQPINILYDQLTKSLDISKRDDIDNIRKSNIKFDSVEGLKVTYTDTLLTPHFDTEISVIKLTEEPQSLFVSFMMDTNDMAKTREIQSAFIKNITLEAI